MKQTIVDDWYETETAAPLRPREPAHPAVLKKHVLEREAIQRRSSNANGGPRRSVFDAWRVVLVVAMFFLALPALAGALPNDITLQSEWACLEGSLSAQSAPSLETAFVEGWEGAVRLLLSLMFVALIAFRLWRDE